MNRHYEKVGVPHKTRVIGFRVTDQELQKILDAQSALRSIGISGTTSDTLRSILKLLLLSCIKLTTLGAQIIQRSLNINIRGGLPLLLKLGG